MADSTNNTNALNELSEIEPTRDQVGDTSWINATPRDDVNDVWSNFNDSPLASSTVEAGTLLRI